MTAQFVRNILVTPEEYLDSEFLSPEKREFVAGAVYVMPEYTNRHNEIAGNAIAALHARLRGQPCRPYNSDTKVRLRLPNELRFYYPDAQVTCHPNPPDDSFQDNPVVVIEVISESTRRADEGEKRAGYLALPSVEVYLLVESGRAGVIAYRRTATGFVREVFTGLAAVIPLGGIGTELPLAEIYERVTLPAPETE